jgi:hypothetical protein
MILTTIFLRYEKTPFFNIYNRKKLHLMMLSASKDSPSPIPAATFHKSSRNGHHILLMEVSHGKV